MESVYMVRGGVGVGAFGTDFNMKLYLSIITVTLCLWDWKRNKRTDYLWVFLIGTIIWSLAELFLQLSGKRVMLHRYLFGIDLPLYFSIPIQGIAEGSTVAIVCIFFSDRFMRKDTRNTAVVVFALLMGFMMWMALKDGVHVRNFGGEVPSRRNMIQLIPLFFLAWMVYIDIRWYRKAPPGLRKRGLYFTAAMLIFSVAWTLGEWLAGTRWIEVGSPGNLRHAPPLIEFGALTFDIVIEITLAYLPYYALPCMWGLIKPKNE